MKKSGKNQKPLRETLEELRQELPDPFQLPTELDPFFRKSPALRLLDNEPTTRPSLLAFLRERPSPHLAQVAVLVLSRMDPTGFYSELLEILCEAETQLIESSESGIWMVRLPPEKIADDLIRLVENRNKPALLLLLQRPEAARFQTELEGFIRRRENPLSRYAMFCYEYISNQNSIPFLTEVSTWLDHPDLAALAGLHLLKSGSASGIDAIRAGLQAPDEEVRAITYHALAASLPATTLSRIVFTGIP